eukprot:5232670-Prymnesium_polylepis.1
MDDPRALRLGCQHGCDVTGTYVPMCPDRLNWEGEPRGDDWFERRGERRGEWRKDDDAWFVSLGCTPAARCAAKI